MKLATDMGSRKSGPSVQTPSLFSASDFSLLVSALRDFGAAWSVVRHPSPLGRRVGEAAVALILCADIVIAGYLFDAAGARWAQTLPLPVVEFFAKVTQLGTSGYIFALSAIVALIAVLASGRLKRARSKRK